MRFAGFGSPDHINFEHITSLGRQFLFQSRYNCCYSGGVTFTFSGGATTQNLTITYSSSIVNSNLKVPTLGITDLNYQIASGKVYLLIQVVKYMPTYLTFNVQVNMNSYLTTLKMTYMALDNSFTPAFSMNYFFPVTLFLFRVYSKADPTSATKPSLTSLPQQESLSTPAMKTYYCLFCTILMLPQKITLSISTLTSVCSTQATTRLSSPQPPI